MANPKDHNNVVLDINTRLTNSSVDEDEKLEYHMKKLDKEFQRQQAQISKVAKKWYLSHFKVDHHQKVIKKREVKYDSLSALLHQVPIVSNTTPLADIQSVKISFDNQTKIIMKNIENMTHALENTRTPDFLSHKLDTKITVSKTSATNRASQSQPYYGMSINSYPGKMLSPILLHGRSALGTFRQFAHDHGPSGPPTDRPTPYVRQSGVAPSIPQASQAKPCMTGQSGYNISRLVSLWTVRSPRSDCPDVHTWTRTPRVRHNLHAPPHLQCTIVAACHHPRMRPNAFRPLQSQKKYRSMSLFGLLRPNLLLALPYIRHKKGKLSEREMCPWAISKVFW
jgi:hypothetical protein